MPSKIKLKQYQQLNAKKFRQKYGLFVVQGLKSVNEIAKSNWPVETILCTSSFLETHGSSFEYAYDVISTHDFSGISSQKNPQEVLAIAKLHAHTTAPTDWQIAVEDINDPGNLGTIIRIADWYGINTIYCSKKTVDLYNSKVIQATMGSFLRVQVIYGDLPELLTDKSVFATILHGENIRTLDKPKKGVILIGNEANGLSLDLLKMVEHTPITIPGNPSAESLNAAMATAICCERLLG